MISLQGYNLYRKQDDTTYICPTYGDFPCEVSTCYITDESELNKSSFERIPAPLKTHNIPNVHVSLVWMPSVALISNNGCDGLRDTMNQWLMRKEFSNPKKYPWNAKDYTDELFGIYIIDRFVKPTWKKFILTVDVNMIAWYVWQNNISDMRQLVRPALNHTHNITEAFTPSIVKSGKSDAVLWEIVLSFLSKDDETIHKLFSFVRYFNLICNDRESRMHLFTD